jgi:hypothetical protein
VTAEEDDDEELDEEEQGKEDEEEADEGERLGDFEREGAVGVASSEVWESELEEPHAADLVLLLLRPRLDIEEGNVADEWQEAQTSRTSRSKKEEKRQTMERDAESAQLYIFPASSNLIHCFLRLSSALSPKFSVLSSPFDRFGLNRLSVPTKVVTEGPVQTKNCSLLAQRDGAIPTKSKLSSIGLRGYRQGTLCETLGAHRTVEENKGSPFVGTDSTVQRSP